MLDVVAYFFFWPMNATIDSEVAIFGVNLCVGLGVLGVWSGMFFLIYCFEHVETTCAVFFGMAIMDGNHIFILKS